MVFCILPTSTNMVGSGNEVKQLCTTLFPALKMCAAHCAASFVWIDTGCHRFSWQPASLTGSLVVSNIEDQDGFSPRTQMP